MKAIYRGKLYDLDGLAHATLTNPDTKETIHVWYGDEDLIVDPTDDEINNLLPDYEHTD